jgi:hypothetical protein
MDNLVQAELRTATELIAQTIAVLSHAERCLTLDQVAIDMSRLAVKSSVTLLHQLAQERRGLPAPLLPLP